MSQLGEDRRDDLLARAAWALAAEVDAIAAPAAGTRARVLQRLAVPSRRPGRRLALALGSLLFLSGSLALATAAAPAAVRAWRAVIERLSPTRAPTAGPRPVKHAATRQSPAGPRIQPLVAPHSPPVPEPARAAPAIAPERPRPARPAAASPGTAVPRSSTLALFYRAHRLHFHQRDVAGALAAWDRYLEADPTGPLVPEARYNRALCLVRLGRAAEARAALLPFADGTLVHYRQAEARALFQELGGSLRPPASP